MDIEVEVEFMGIVGVEMALVEHLGETCHLSA